MKSFFSYTTLCGIISWTVLMQCSVNQFWGKFKFLESYKTIIIIEMKIWKQLEEIGDCVPPLQMIAFFYIFHQGHTKVVQDLRKLIIFGERKQENQNCNSANTPCIYIFCLQGPRDLSLCIHIILLLTWQNAVSSGILYRRSVCVLQMNFRSVRFKACLKHFPSLEANSFLCLFAFFLIATTGNNDACGLIRFVWINPVLFTYIFHHVKSFFTSWCGDYCINIAVVGPWAISVSLGYLQFFTSNICA